MVKRALISVSDKSGIVEFAKELVALGIEIISTGGTAKALNDAGIATLEVQDVTGFPECLDGRVKTLHPKIHGGLLAMRGNPAHMAHMKELGVTMIDLVVINLYPFRETIAKPGTRLAEAIEQIDIGGPAMLRSSAKNYQDVTVLVDPRDYARVLKELAQSGGVSVSLNFELAKKVFSHTASYDALIADYLARQGPTDQTAAPVNADADRDDAEIFPDKFTVTFEKAQEMRYGENPHQKAAFFREPVPAAGSLATFSQLHGKELSYNNIGDLDGALSLLREFSEPAMIAVKHANPCGAAVADSIFEAYKKAYESDPTSIFGGILAANRTIDAATAAEINKIFIEIIAAPGYDADALAILTKKKNIRVLTLDTAAARAAEAGRASGVAAASDLFFKKVGGGLLVQTENRVVADRAALTVATKKQPTPDEIEDLLFGMAVVKHTKSNAIVLAKGCATVGVGPGQTSRIMAAKIAIEIAGGRASGAVAASDAFFPFGDCVEAMAAVGVTAIIQPGGSQNDKESIDACDRLGIAMVFTGIRHFMH
ncbi:MAG: bifunctional phosphoribosylaminoimidazolecarboxamide formyltransferase/IMP cyclohydrolase [Clostridiales bacterium]|jgi:phosphoribosylaminoimidazolecarboxamide formyltransferase/IMP cyclohydrolase|nr:bifunctional phosphoribosylaminoimidazolecarboxamide formyltransferase/IMP cyclohydrolase [Clostridiales bacterium]